MCNMLFQVLANRRDGIKPTSSAENVNCARCGCQDIGTQTVLPLFLSKLEVSAATERCSSTKVLLPFVFVSIFLFLTTRNYSI